MDPKMGRIGPSSSPITMTRSQLPDYVRTPNGYLPRWWKSGGILNWRATEFWLKISMNWTLSTLINMRKLWVIRFFILVQRHWFTRPAERRWREDTRQWLEKLCLLKKSCTISFSTYFGQAGFKKWAASNFHRPLWKITSNIPSRYVLDPSTITH